MEGKMEFKYHSCKLSSTWRALSLLPLLNRSIIVDLLPSCFCVSLKEPLELLIGAGDRECDWGAIWRQLRSLIRLLGDKKLCVEGFPIWKLIEGFWWVVISSQGRIESTSNQVSNLYCDFKILMIFICLLHFNFWFWFESQLSYPMAGNAKSGEKIFLSKCAQCHSLDRGNAHRRQGNAFPFWIFISHFNFENYLMCLVYLYM